MFVLLLLLKYLIKCESKDNVKSHTTVMLSCFLNNRDNVKKNLISDYRESQISSILIEVLMLYNVI